MKRKLLLLLALMAIGLSGAWAYDFSAVAPSGQTLYYNLVGGNAHVTFQNSSSPRYSNLTGALVIPATVTYNGTTYSVTCIGGYAFYRCSSLTSVTIPNSVTSIWYSAFSGCSGLTSVTIPNSVTRIDNFAFYGCSGLTSVTIPNSVTSIGNHAFYNCSGLTSVTIPNSLTRIGYSAFSGCSGLTSVTIPNSVTSIESYAFSRCSGLTSVTIGNSVTSIEQYAFVGCSNVDTLYYNARDLTTTSVWGNSSSSYNSYGFRPMTLKHLVIGDSVQTLPNYLLYNQDSLTSVTMEGVTPPTLGSYVFDGNASNRIIYVPCGAYDNYYNATNGWWNYRYDLSDPIVDIDVTVNTDTERGSASIIPLRGQNIRCDSTVVVSATPNYGYHFDYWSTGSTLAQDTIAIEGDTVITAYFAKNQYAVNVVPNYPARGNVYGSDTIDYLDSVTISAVANYGYHFTRWNDNDTHQVRTVQVTQNKTYTAYFDYNQYQLTAASADTVQGTCSGSGAYSYLANRTISATANYGYHFTQWSDGNTDNPRTIQLTQDTIFTAEFAKNQYEITAVSDDESLGMVSGGGTFDYLDTITLTATTIAEHHHFVRWSDNDTNADRTVIVTEDATYTAYFAADQTEGIDEVEQMPTIVVRGNSIAVGNAQNQMLSIYDITGRMIVREQAVDGKQYTMPHSGVYMVQVGNHPAEKVVVVR